MRINNPKTGEFVETHCDGRCYHHHMAMMFGDPEKNPEARHICQECGCPMTETGWKLWLEQHPEAEVKVMQGRPS